MHGISKDKDRCGSRRRKKQSQERLRSHTSRKGQTGAPASLNGALYTGKKTQKNEFSESRESSTGGAQHTQVSAGTAFGRIPSATSLFRVPAFRWPRGDREFLPSGVRTWKRREARQRNVT